MSEMEKLLGYVEKYGLKHEVKNGRIYFPSFEKMRTYVLENGIGMLTFRRRQGKLDITVCGSCGADYLFNKIDPEDAEKEGIEARVPRVPYRHNAETPTEEDKNSMRLTWEERARLMEERKQRKEQMGEWFDGDQ